MHQMSKHALCGCINSTIATSKICCLQVLVWESRHAGECAMGPRLKKFQGKPNELSPKARLLNFLVSTAATAAMVPLKQIGLCFHALIHHTPVHLAFVAFDCYAVLVRLAAGC